MMTPLEFSNGYGGFDPATHDYVITLTNGQTTPLPWVNIIANPKFGTMVTETGLGNTWFGNSSLFRLTPWVNDPITEQSGEKIIIEDFETIQTWSPTPLPIRESTPYEIRHGQGYSVFEHSSNDITSVLTVFVDPQLPVKIYQLKLKNNATRPKKLLVTFSCDWVLGDLKKYTKDHLIIGQNTAQNPVSCLFPNHVAFQTPAKAKLTLAPGEENCLNFFLGVSLKKDLKKTLKTLADPTFSATSLVDVKKFWAQVKNTMVIATPDPALNTLFNYQLLYQTLSCRLWGKTGFYQPGGAFGFRDQIQDCLALVWADPKITRDHLLLCARHQFTSGEVHHWWHEPLGTGITSESSDAALWLPHITARYLAITGDQSILAEKIPYLDDQKSSATLFDHCVGAINHTLALKGPHGLPLILGSDWNDSLNNIGTQKKGESAWLSMFLIVILTELIPFCDPKRQKFYQAEIKNQTKILEKFCWDGRWFLRAFTDDGGKIGSQENAEIKIESLPQSWSVICQTLDKNLASQAINSAAEKLINYDHGFVKLLDPPVTDPNSNPGYIRSYPPGFRENGGAYNHGAIFLAQAFALLGKGDQAMTILNMVNPITHSSSKAQAEKYAVEPYVVASDIYTQEPYLGHGGWTWYTGSAGTFYMTVVENILGLKFEGEKLHINPCIPKDWPGFNVKFMYKSTPYDLTVTNPTKPTVINLVDDKKLHEIKMYGEVWTRVELNPFLLHAMESVYR